MKPFITICLSIFFSSIVFSQTDSTDITLTKAPAIIQSQMDSILFGGGNFESYHIEFTISDTSNFGELTLDFSNTGQTINRLSKTLAELQSENLIDANWLVDIDLGNFETGISYRISLLIKNYAGVGNSPIIKHY